jgi:hypothetical protein
VVRPDRSPIVVRLEQRRYVGATGTDVLRLRHRFDYQWLKPDRVALALVGVKEDRAR